VPVGQVQATGNDRRHRKPDRIVRRKAVLQLVQPVAGDQGQKVLAHAAASVAGQRGDRLQYLDAANTQSIPSWTRFDAGVRYTFERKDGKPIAVRFNVENLFDLNYWASANSTIGLAMGAPRTFLLSLSADF